MVVSRKRNNNKGVKQKNTSSLFGSGKDLSHGKPKEPLESLSCNKFWAGPSDTNDSNGKRKAQSELNTSPTLSCSPLDKLLISNGLVIMGLDQDPVVNVGCVSKELHK